jgi:hypothetical protein
LVRSGIERRLLALNGPLAMSESSLLFGLALQLPFRFEVGSLSDHLMGSAPE